MIENYIKIAFRNLRRYPGQAGINILGLAIGLACCLFILLFIRDELGYDRHHANAQRMFRLVRSTSALTAAPMGPALQGTIAGVEQTTRITGENGVSLRHGDELPLTADVVFADTSYFDIFDHTFLQGSPETALSDPKGVVLTRSIAYRIFGDRPALGENLTVQDEEEADFYVSAVIENVPRQSHFTFDVIGSFEVIAAGTNRLENWTTNWLFTYGVLAAGVAFQQIEASLPAFFEQHTGEAWTRFHIQPLLDIRLNSAHMTSDIAVQGNVAYIYLFAAVAVLILLIACINFANLSTARAFQRAREIGVRKSLGASRVMLMWQFFGESFLAAFLGLVVASLLVASGWPAFRMLSEKTLTLGWDDSGFLAVAFLGIVLFVGLVAGSYPALVLSRFNPIRSLKGHSEGARSGWLRQGLVVFQFAISVGLIFATLVIYRQLEFVKETNLGFDKEQIVVMDFGEGLNDRYEVVKREFTTHPSVLEATASDNIPGQGVSDFLFRPEGQSGEDDLLNFDTYFIDEYYTSVFEMDMLLGRSFKKAVPSESQGFLLNETAWRHLQSLLGEDWDDPLGKQLDFYLPGASGWEVYRSGQVVGVVSDFHYQSLHAEIGPLVMQVLPQAFDYLAVKVRTENLPATIEFLSAKWALFGPKRPFDYVFLNDQFDQLYRNEARLANMFVIFASLAILVACLGLLGLISVAIVQRTKEIGIRKVLGASSMRVAGLLTSSYLKLVALAIVIAAPLCYIGLSRWLESFAYRVHLSWDVFVLAAFVAIGTAGLTMALQTIKAVRANPVDSLRYE